MDMTTKTYSEMREEFVKTLRVEQHYAATSNGTDKAELDSRWNLLTELCARMFGEDESERMISESTVEYNSR